MKRAPENANPDAAKGPKKVRVDHGAVAEFPNLVRSSQGLKWQGVVLDRFERRQLNVESWERLA